MLVWPLAKLSLSEVRNAYLHLNDRSTKFDVDRPGFLYDVETSATVSLLHQFGWIRLAYAVKPKPGKAAHVREIQRTDFGDAMFVATCQFESFEDENPRELQAKMQNYFPDWKETLAGQVAEYRDGQFTFKVSLGETWRRIVAPASVSLEQLADAILDAYQFDHDHLYQFELRDTTGSAITTIGNCTSFQLKGITGR